MTDALDIFCTTCDRNITLEEVRNSKHDDHEFSNTDRTAFMYVSQFLKSPRATAKRNSA